MMRVMTLLAVVAAVGLVAGYALSEEHDTPKPVVQVKGVVVKVDAEKKTVVVKVKQEGADAKEETVATGEKTKITVDGKEAKLDDLKADMTVVATMAEGGKVAAKIEAKTAEKK